jgi:uncharacterized protein (DUF885 family)
MRSESGHLRRLVLALLLLSLPSAPAPAHAASRPDARLNELTTTFIHGWLERRPQLATRLGVHTWDHELRPLTPASAAEDVAWLDSLQHRLDGIPRATLSPGAAVDRDLLAWRIARERFEIEVTRGWERNPNVYLELVAGSLQSLAQREFASPVSRLRSITARLEGVPEVLRAARIQLQHPPRIYTEIAIGQFTGALKLYREDLPALADRVKEPHLLGAFVQADSTAIASLLEFITYLRDDLLPASDGDFRLGRERYQQKLAVDELETTPVDSLLARARFSLDTTRARMERVAQRIAPGMTVAAALDSLSGAAPSETALVSSISSELNGIRAYLRARRLVTMPSVENLTVRETPVFRRATSFASMESPGVWESGASEAYYNVTPPEPGWSAAQKHDHLGFFNPWMASFVSVHEAIPGHYYQFLAVRRAPTRMHQGFSCGTSTEGWAHYCEQMMLEQGFGGGDPRAELAQLDLALQRLGRMVVGLSMHTGTMTLEEATRLFQEQCWMPRVNAEREARRGTIDPTYLVYTLGKWRILELRDELRAQLGPRFDLRVFHDAFLHQGPIPISIARAALLTELAPPGRDATAHEGR